jgi:hypothetical protein
MRYLFRWIILPCIFGGAVSWGILGLISGRGVEKDYAWILGAIVFVMTAYTQSRLTALEDRLNESENLLVTALSDRGSSSGTPPKSSIVLKANPPT